MNADERKAMRERHSPKKQDGVMVRYCRVCAVKFPCDAAILLEELEKPLHHKW